MQKKKYISISFKNACRFLFIIIVFLVLLVFHNQLTCLLVALGGVELDVDCGVETTETYLRYHNAVVYGGIGIIVFNIMIVFEYVLRSNRLRSSRLLEYGLLAMKMFRWAAFFIIMDLILQNLGGNMTFLSDFSMTYQSIGGLVGIEIYFIREFFGAAKKVD